METTGPLSETGPSQDKAVKIAVEYANEQAKKAGVAIQAKDIGADVQGDPQAADRLLPLVYDELRRLAAHKLAREKPGQTLQATALVHEAYLRLVAGAEERG